MFSLIKLCLRTKKSLAFVFTATFTCSGSAGFGLTTKLQKYFYPKKTTTINVTPVMKTDAWRRNSSGMSDDKVSNSNRHLKTSLQKHLFSEPVSLICSNNYFLATNSHE